MLSELPEIEIVGRARDGQTAIHLINKQSPDVVVLDIRMPKQNGMDVLQNIKRNGPVPLVIIFTNFPYPQYRKRCTQLGADFFFDKSTEFQELKNIFNKLIKHYKN
jgi:YesN/AraC family two-component response regulator